MDPRVALLLTEAYRHGKAIVATSGTVPALEAVGVPAAAPGIVTGDGDDWVQVLLQLLAGHRGWQRMAAPGSPIAPS
ncbi:MAG TPA: hypothetical protein VES01_08755 [Dermatophilaceae bacterium]|nr:hypothetical protein [Dermatophilaceae bacterium]